MTKVILFWTICDAFSLGKEAWRRRTNITRRKMQLDVEMSDEIKVFFVDLLYSFYHNVLQKSISLQGKDGRENI